MDLSRRLGGYFDSAIRTRGEEYYWQGRVRIAYGSSDSVGALVRGSRTYDVKLDWDDGILTGWCDCAYFDTDGACKHVWATLLASEAKGYLSAVSNHSPIFEEGVHDPDEEFKEPRRTISPAPRPAPKPAPTPAWKRRIEEIVNPGGPMVRPAEPWPAKRQIVYVVDVPSSVNAGRLVLTLGSRDVKVSGDGYTKPKSFSPRRSLIPLLPEGDREIVAAIAGGVQHYGWGYGLDGDQVSSSRVLDHPLAQSLIPRAVGTGRCFLRTNVAEWDNLLPLSWGGDEPWHFAIELRRIERKGWMTAGFLRRNEERMELSEALLITPSGFVFTKDRVAPLAMDTPFEWISHLQKNGAIEAPDKDREQLLAALLSAPGLPSIEVPDELRYEEAMPQPRPALKIVAGERGDGGKLRAELSFDYEGRWVRAVEPARGFYDAAARRFLRRHESAEKSAAEFLETIGVKYQGPSYWDREPRRELAPSKLPRIVRQLVEAGWHIEAEGKIFKRPGEFRMEVSSGVDWFELHGQVDYGETSAQLPALLEALKRGENMVRLDDGSYGLLPEEWLRRIGMIAGAGAAQNGHLRFGRNQIGLLDALLATQPEARCDETFARVREELRVFDGVKAAEQPAGFSGHLRDYQREGLGWMEFLRRFSFGGCLADDMGVGKTAQLLALLETRRTLRETGETIPPSLVVVPRSLVFNWKEEAARFTPKLRVLDHTGAERSGADFSGYDLILITYGTLRRDAVLLKDIDFDYVVLDEAQAIKNAGTESAKAARLLKGTHRLALSGTPVENHLGELWALFEFLNPGMLGTAQVFKLAGPAPRNAARNPDEETRRLLACAVRPFILRRTKQQVARELPPKTEQTIYCEMKAEQRKLYNELRDHYRNALLARIETEGLAKSKIQVLEALLRLRQAACHPGLLDKNRLGDHSTKLESLLNQLREVLDEGHKALVFSQFTSLLSIVRERLDSEGAVYEYLDGKTRDRQGRVERFQNDPDCRLFLVSLKAGGLGLNLTAAEYVFLLDPWWNPAVEAQAVDRAHRIGQTRQVFAYRLIARDTVEEKVLELQKTKRELAAAIIGEDNSLIHNLGREDLELLLS
ncbi:MAG TPA: DEAD/DEAH box helicase [Bryobacteraceae bacterium]